MFIDRNLIYNTWVSFDHDYYFVFHSKCNKRTPEKVIIKKYYERLVEEN